MYVCIDQSLCSYRYKDVYPVQVGLTMTYCDNLSKFTPTKPLSPHKKQTAATLEIYYVTMSFLRKSSETSRLKKFTFATNLHSTILNQFQEHNQGQKKTA